MKQTEYLVYGLTRNSQNPLDPRFTINSLSTIDNELLMIYRYPGLIFFVKDINEHYLFENNLSEPISLRQLLSNKQINGIISEDYSTLIEDLNNTTENIGSLITVFPLGVTFILTPIGWKYHSGDYNVESTIILESIPLELRSTNKLILLGINNITRHLFNSDLEISDEIIYLSDFPDTIELNRYYNINGIFYYSIANQLIKLSEKTQLFDNLQLTVGDNIINHTLNSTYISGKIWINTSNGLNDVNKLIPVEIINISLNQYNLISSLELTTNLILTTNT